MDLLSPRLLAPPSPIYMTCSTLAKHLHYGHPRSFVILYFSGCYYLCGNENQFSAGPDQFHACISLAEERCISLVPLSNFINVILCLFHDSLMAIICGSFQIKDQP